MLLLHNEEILCNHSRYNAWNKPVKHTEVGLCLPVSQYVLNDKVSYPEETFMDWEFKISVMYDIAKVKTGSAE